MTETGLATPKPLASRQLLGSYRLKILLSYLTGKFDSIAVRLCNVPAVVQLCEASGVALTSTSANLSGEPPAAMQRSHRSVWSRFSCITRRHAR